ncbi:phosphoribosylamine--glycine ligase [Wohlfahrtiimonas chitiniclastica]|uniref:phosphoribosylamine--glycine ligase n=1 Tax=Wohlfahrtiimonas chitiniclastica TaxID=400946 RepID=UPI001BD026B9|nr:phosphoribosylamine--glycine ligase [Wohlfahrtiimonas chitiniclastica]MBS7837584.1 phosphoribosylamine--glycine ligase [Wohlfahrtiimonas chitiniclastica]
MMKILIVGKGGREHALAWKVKQSAQVSEVYVAPGNVGMKDVAHLVNINETASDELANWAEANQIDLVIIGPESSLVVGVADQMQARGIKVWGPTQAAAQIEGSKDFAKVIMNRYGVPTAAHQTFTQVDEALSYLEKVGVPIVIKADGLAAGKGVVLPQTMDEAKACVVDMLEDNRFGDAGARIVIEEFLEGNEYSLMCFVHGNKVVPMMMAQDHKRAYDNDEGPNTGGMGAYAPCFTADSEETAIAVKTIMQPVADGLVKEGMPFTGFLYGGLILTKEGFKTIEFNARFGDPEAEVILPLLESDLVDVILTMLSDNPVPSVAWQSGYCVGVVLASKGYPEQPETGYPLKTVAVDESINMIFNAGVAEKAGQLVSNGGRILVATGLGETFDEAKAHAYALMKAIETEGTFYRTDIGHRFKG